MAITGVYYIPTPNPTSPTALQQVIDRLTLLFNPRPLGRWGLEQKLFRESINLAAGQDSNRAPSSAQTLRYVQVLNFTYRPRKNYFATSLRRASIGQNGSLANGSVNGQKDDLISIKTISRPEFGTEDGFDVTEKFMGPMWAHRQTLQVYQGVAYEIDEFRVRVGDLRQLAPRQQVKGTVVEIQWVRSEDGDEEAEDEMMGEVLIKGFWKKFGMELGEKQVVKEFVRMPRVQNEEIGLVKQWVELLRLRGI
jgi:hypothetical protein